jgi:hypothetical protein
MVLYSLLGRVVYEIDGVLWSFLDKWFAHVEESINQFDFRPII